MTSDSKREAAEIRLVEAGLAQLAGLYREGAQLPSAADLMSRSRLRQREIAAERLARWHGRTQHAALGVLLLGIAAVTFATLSDWGPWLLEPVLARTVVPASAGAAVAVGALFASGAAVLWVLRQFAEE